MTQAIVGTGGQVLNAGSSLASAPAQTANALELATMGNLKSLLAVAVAQATTSGTFVDFGSIPAAAKRITVMFNGISSNGTSLHLVQLGTSGGLEVSGYASSSVGGAPGNTLSGAGGTTGFIAQGSGNSGAAFSGALTLTRVTGNTWVVSGVIGASAGALSYMCSGIKTLSAELTTLRLTTVNGTDAFDAGSVNILVEL